MRASIAVLVVTMAFGLACGGMVDDDPPPAVPVPLDPSPDPEPPPPPGRTTLPVDPFDDVEGFLAVAPLEGASWTPARLAIPVVGGWEEVQPGARFSALAAEGHIGVSFVGVEPVDWCTFSVRAPVFEPDEPVSGVVWITQEAGEEEATAPEPSRAPTADRRLYSLPLGGELDLLRGRSVVEVGGGRPWVDMWGSGASVDLRSETAMGPSYPALVWTASDELWIVLRRHRADTAELSLLHVAGRNGVVAGTVPLPGPCTGAGGVP